MKEKFKTAAIIILLIISLILIIAGRTGIRSVILPGHHPEHETVTIADSMTNEYQLTLIR